MKKIWRKVLILAAIVMIAVAGREIGSTVRQNEEAPAYGQTAAASGSRQAGRFHLDIIAWELTIIGCGYLIWAAASWKDEQTHEYQNLEKSEYAAQE